MGVIVRPGRGRPSPAGSPAIGDWTSSGRDDPALGEGGAEEADESDEPDEPDEDAEGEGEADCGGAGCAADGPTGAPGCEAEGDADDGTGDGAGGSRADGATDGEPDGSGARAAVAMDAPAVAVPRTGAR
ncbi:hypothetical protein [Streptomyces sp. NPDC050422]|uniref:hypothetical protein n=1 Tax=Streptomyces sp. NPDC050422 TaxID=3365614 RepID=UPI0037AA6E45